MQHVSCECCCVTGPPSQAAPSGPCSSPQSLSLLSPIACSPGTSSQFHLLHCEANDRESWAARVNALTMFSKVIFASCWKGPNRKATSLNHCLCISDHFENKHFPYYLNIKRTNLMSGFIEDIQIIAVYFLCNRILFDLVDYLSTPTVCVCVSERTCVFTLVCAYVCCVCMCVCLCVCVPACVCVCVCDFT